MSADEQIVPVGRRYLELKINFPEGQPIIFKTMATDKEAVEILQSLVDIQRKGEPCSKRS